MSLFFSRRISNPSPIRSINFLFSTVVRKFPILSYISSYPFRSVTTSPLVASAMGKLTGKVAIVTASTDGIGFSIAKKLAADGAKVIISSRKEQNVEAAVNKLKNLGFQNVIGTVCHVANQDDRAKLFSKAFSTFDRIDILVSNAAVNPVFGATEECSDEAWDKIFEINVKCPFMLTKEVLPYFRKHKAGNIIYISSIAGLQPFSMLGAYSVSKTALLGLTKVFAQELAEDNITVNCIAPGIIKTKFSRAIYENETAHNIAISKIPMNRLGEPDDVGGVVSFLCTDDAKYITGETIVVSGGMQSRL